MNNSLSIFTALHKNTKRDFIARMNDDKIECMKVARQYGADFWDGDRRYGYGGYSYDGRWATVAKQLVDHYHLPANAKILDVGCGKGYLLYELKKLLPDATVRGFDISEYAIQNAKPEIRDSLFLQRAQDHYQFADNEFDLVISLTTLHNLPINDLKSSLQEIERVGKEAYIVVESYRNEVELFNLQCWALTCESFLTPNEWLWLFKEYKYTGDYELIFF